MCCHLRGNFTLETSVVLWNPATEQFKPIPQSLVESKPYDANVLVSYSTFSNLHGYGYDGVIDDYKIIPYVMFKITSCNFHGVDYVRATDDYKIIHYVMFKTIVV